MFYQIKHSDWLKLVTETVAKFHLSLLSVKVFEESFLNWRHPSNFQSCGNGFASI